MVTTIQTIPASGGTFDFDLSTYGGDLTVILQTTGNSPITLLADVNITASNSVFGNKFIVLFDTNMVTNLGLSTYSFSIQSNAYSASSLENPFVSETIFEDAIGTYTTANLLSDGISGTMITDGSIQIAKLGTLASGKTLVGDGSNEIVADYIKDANIDASAGIARTKIASGTASRVLVNDGAGALAELAQLTPALGGTGLSTSSSTGFPIISSGTWSAGALTETIRVDVSFLTAGQGTYYVALPACRVSKVKARVTSAIAGTDDATITCQNASSTNMTNGLITIPLSSAHGVGVSVTPTENNTFTAGQEMQLVVAKTTNGGLASVDITFTRTALT